MTPILMTCEKVEYAENMKSVRLDFVSDELNIIRSVKYNLQAYDSATKKYHDDEKTEERIEQEIFDDLGLTFDTINLAEGLEKEVYCYDTFTKLHPVDIIEKFTEDMVGDVFEGDITDIRVNHETFRIEIRFKIDGKTYKSNMNFNRYNPAAHSYRRDDVKERKVYEKFKTKFGVPVDEADRLKGKTVKVMVKQFGQNIYGEVLKVSKAK